MLLLLESARAAASHGLDRTPCDLAGRSTWALLIVLLFEYSLLLPLDVVVPLVVPLLVVVALAVQLVFAREGTFFWHSFLSICHFF